MMCSITGCPGQYKERKILHTARHKGQVMVIAHVPAELFSVGGNVLLKSETIRRLEKLLETPTLPSKSVPLYEYA